MDQYLVTNGEVKMIEASYQPHTEVPYQAKAKTSDRVAIVYTEDMDKAERKIKRIVDRTELQALRAMAFRRDKMTIIKLIDKQLKSIS